MAKMKIIGMKKLCSATNGLDPVGYAPRYKIQVHLDISTGRLYWADIIGNGYIQYNDDDLVYLLLRPDGADGRGRRAFCGSP